MSLPVYVVHYEAPDWCATTVRSLLASDVEVDLTIVNNGGDLGDLPVCVADMPRNLGYTGGANWGIRDSGASEFVVVTSHDVEVSVSALRHLLAAAVSFPRAGLLGANVGSRGSLIGPASDGVEWCEWTSGSCLLLRRSCLEDVGLFDERLGSYGDDLDLGKRANAAGWKVGRVIAAAASHRGSAVGPGRRERMIMSNRLLLAFKFGGSRGLYRAILLELPRQIAYQLKLGLRSPTEFYVRLWMICNQVLGACQALLRLRSFADSAART